MNLQNEKMKEDIKKINQRFKKLQFKTLETKTKIGYAETFSLSEITKSLYSNYEQFLPKSQSKTRRNVLAEIKDVIQLTEDFSFLGCNKDEITIRRYPRGKIDILPGNF